MEALWRNVKYAARMLAKSPGFTVVTVLTLMLGIGANTAIFSVVYAALLRPLPYRDADRLVTLAENRRQFTGYEVTEASYPDYRDWQRTAKSFQSLAGYSGDAFTLTGNGEPENIFAEQVTPNFFSTLGVQPLLGRDFVDGEDQIDGPHVAMLTYGFWQSDFGADPGIIGRTIRLDNKPVTIVGVLPRNFEFAPANSATIWVPVHPDFGAATRRNLRWISIFGRVAPGVSPEQAHAEMDIINAQLVKEYPIQDASIYIVMGTMRARIVGKIQPLLLVLLGAVGFVLLIACANVGSLMLTRSTGRRKEFAIRTALGATRGNLLAQLLTESALLSCLGAAAGLVAAQWGVHMLLSAIPETLLRSTPYLRDARMNLPVLVFVACVTLLTAILFGLAPGLSVSRSAAGDALKDESRGGTSTGHARLRNAFVIAEIAICLVLLAGAGLMLQSFRALMHRDTGFDTHNLLTFDVGLPDTSYPTGKEWPNASPASAQFEHEFTRQVAGLPGVQSVASVSSVPMTGGGTIRFVIEGRPSSTGEEDECNIVSVDNTYFPTMKIPLVSGRVFNGTDTWEAPWRAMVNEAFAKKYLRNENPLGKRIRFTFNPNEPFREIVGVVGDVTQNDLALPLPPVIYTANDQGPSPYLSYLVRTSGDPAGSISSIRTMLQKMDPQLALIAPTTVEQIVSQSPSVFLRRYPSYLIGSFAGLALLLAMVGLYGLISYTVLQRTREIGIRMAMGAQRRDVLRLLLRQGMSAILAGLAIGLVTGLALTRLMASLLYGVTGTDPATFAGVALLLAGVSLVAALMPARRAMRVDPMVALRYE
jgi:predicted permease